MKQWGFVFTVLLCSQAFAQESTSTLQTNEIKSATTEMLSTSTAKAPVVVSPWKFTLGSENYSYEMDQKTYGSGAPIISYNFVGAKYVISPKWEVELRQQFQFATNKENLGGRDQALHRNSLEMAETVLRVAAKPAWNLLGSKMQIFEVRYYAPTDHVAQERGELGRVRADAWVEWAPVSKWSFAAWFSPRVAFNSQNNPNVKVGADAEYYQVKAAPYVMYNVSDKIIPYYAYNLVEKYSQAQRGDWNPDMTNVGAHEIGLFLNYGAWTINPSFISETNLNDGGGSLLTEDSRAYSYENLSYNLNVYATF
jgi:hypothetical protein